MFSIVFCCVSITQSLSLGRLSAGLVIYLSRIRAPSEAEICSILNGVPLHTTSYYDRHPDITEKTVEKDVKSCHISIYRAGISFNSVTVSWG